jgi:hypothetical protein
MSYSKSLLKAEKLYKEARGLLVEAEALSCKNRRPLIRRAEKLTTRVANQTWKAAKSGDPEAERGYRAANALRRVRNQLVDDCARRR